MRIVNLIHLPWVPSDGRRLVVDHSTLPGLATGLEADETVVLRVRGAHALALVQRVDYRLDDTTYHLVAGRLVDAAELPGLGAVDAPLRAWEAEDVMAAMCRLKRTALGCEEACVHCVLNPDSEQGRALVDAAADATDDATHAVPTG